MSKRRSSALRLIRCSSAAARSRGFIAAALAVLAFSTLSVAGCGADSEDPSGAGGSGNSFSCSQATDTYSVGLAKDSAQGTFRVELMNADPAPPQKGANLWLIHVTDPQGADINGADLRVTPRMPEHGHGSTEQTQVTESGDGKYELDPVFLSMAGYWAVDISLTQGAQTDTARYDFCVAP